MFLICISTEKNWVHMNCGVCMLRLLVPPPDLEAAFGIYLKFCVVLCVTIYNVFVLLSHLETIQEVEKLGSSAPT